MLNKRMTEKEANSDKLRRGQHIEDAPFDFRIKTVKDLGKYSWFKEECKDDELVLRIRNDRDSRGEPPVVLRTLPFCVGKLPTVSGIWFEDGGISDVVASALGELKGVRQVRFGADSSLRIVPGFLSSLSHDLNRLQIWNKTGASLSDSAGVLPSLTNLKELDLWDCGLKELPANFSHLTQLTKLNMYRNKELERLPEEICSKMKKLEVLDLRECSLRELPANFGDLTKLHTFLCDRNPLIKPPMAVCKQGVGAIRAYFLTKMTESLKRFKIILLGKSCAGKTSLIRTMINKKSTCTKEEDRTIGADEYELKLSNDKKAKALDCGGQKCYLLTNQLFVSENAMIWIVVDISQYQLTKESFRQHIGQYLQVVYERCRRNQVLIVFTKIDRFPGTFSRRIKSALRFSVPPQLSSYQKHVVSQLEMLKQSREMKIEKSRFSAESINCQDIKISDDLVFASAMQMETVRRLEELADRLAEDRSVFPTVDDVIPSAWINFEEELVKKSADKHLSVMDMSKVIDLGSRHGLQKEHVKIVLSYYHQVGTLLHFSHPRLSNVVFGSSKGVVDVLKQVFCHTHAEREYKKDYVALYDSPVQFYADKRLLVDNGILTIPFFKVLLSSLGLRPEFLNVIINMLLSFDFAYVKGSSCFRDWSQQELRLDVENADVLGQLEKANAHLLLPWLLEEKCPDIAISKFPLECPSLWIEVDIFFAFAFSLPMGIFAQFSARCHHHSDLIQHWSSGFLLEHGPVLAQFTCQVKDDNPEIHCRSRVPKSVNALLRLFHVLWRCIVGLKELLKTVPGCLYETFLNFNNGVEIIDAKIKITEDWKLETASDMSDNVIFSDCKKAVEEVVHSISGRQQSLIDAYSNDLGKSSSRYFKGVAMAVESHRCSDLALCLHMDWESRERNVGLMLKKWLEEKGKDAIVAVLSDALQECGLDAVRTECFKDIRDIHQSTQEATQWRAHKLVKFPDGKSSVADHLYLRLAVAEVGNAEWREISANLGFESFHLANIPNSCERNSDKVSFMIDEWLGDKGRHATVEGLLNACESAKVSLDRVLVEYSKRLKLLS